VEWPTLVGFAESVSQKTEIAAKESGSFSGLENLQSLKFLGFFV
jgi:hypothetical protein